jgi:hypothetical protein
MSVLGNYALDLTQTVGANCSVNECEEDAVGVVHANLGGNNQTVSGTLDQSTALAGSSPLAISATYTAQGGLISPPGILWITGKGGSLFTDYLIDDTQSVLIENDTNQWTLGVLDIQH